MSQDQIAELKQQIISINQELDKIAKRNTYLEYQLKQVYSKFILSQLSQFALWYIVSFYSKEEFCGSGFLFEIEDRLFCATAEHVITEVQEKGEPWLNLGYKTPLPEKIYKTSGKEDIAFFEISRSTKIHGKRFLPLSYLDPTFAKVNKELLVISGYTFFSQEREKKSDLLPPPRLDTYGSIIPDKNPEWIRNYNITIQCPDFGKGENTLLENTPIEKWDFRGSSGCPIWDGYGGPVRQDRFYPNLRWIPC